MLNDACSQSSALDVYLNYSINHLCESAEGNKTQREVNINNNKNENNA